MLNGVARARAEIDGCRHLVREAAHLMDTKGNTDAHTRQVCSLSRSPGRSRPSGMKRSRPPLPPPQVLSIVKALVPETVQRVVDHAIQARSRVSIRSISPPRSPVPPPLRR